jgi:glucose-1-phosphate cytidylyltransferase
MKVVILAGGLGYRLKEETEFKPKPLLNVGGKPILWHIMKIYSHYGYNNFIIALGYKGNLIKEYFLNEDRLENDFTINTQDGSLNYYKSKNKEKDNFTVTLVDTGLDTLPGERILRIKSYIPKEDEDFLVTYGDGVSDININKLVKFHKKNGLIGTVTGVHPKSRYGILSINGKKVAYSFKEKPLLMDWINGGFMVFNKTFFKYLRKGEYEHKALKRLIEKRQLDVYTHEGFWQSVDTYPDLDLLNNLWKEKPKWKVWN